MSSTPIPSIATIIYTRSSTKVRGLAAELERSNLILTESIFTETTQRLLIIN